MPPRDREYFASALDERRLRLMTQPIIAVPRALVVQRWEVLTCIWDVDGPLPRRVFAVEWINAICRNTEAMQCLDLNTLLGVLETPRTGQFWVNLSALSLADPWFIEALVEAISASPIQHRQIIFEVTEYMPITGLVVSACNALREAGCGLALDDFGAGYSSALHLTDLPLTALKIDGALCRLAEQNDRAHTVLAAFIDLAHDIGLEVVAEGIETAAQQQVLVAMGCDLFQGFLFGDRKPLREPSRQIESSDGLTRFRTPDSEAGAEISQP